MSIALIYSDPQNVKFQIEPLSNNRYALSAIWRVEGSVPLKYNRKYQLNLQIDEETQLSRALLTVYFTNMI